MDRLRDRDPAFAYLLMRGASQLFSGLMGTINLVYQVEVAHLDPLGLLLVGSVLELTCLLLQVPTGLLADTYSRKLAVVAGTVLVGAGFMLEGVVPNFWTILLAQVIWGAGASLADGADDAWITEEVGTERASRLFLRASQVGQATGLAGIVAGVSLATVQLNLPIVLGGLLTLLLGVALHFLMREEKFVPAPRHENGDLAGMLAKGHETLAVIRAKPVLLSILLITAFAGASSEGFDRLFQVHLLRDVGLPHLSGINPLYWFAFLNVGSVVLGVGVTEWVRRRLDLRQHRVAVRALLKSTAILSAAIIGFAFAPAFPAAVIAYWVARNAARVWGPVQRAWLNRSLEPATRATLFSVDGQADALGQIASGPALGLIARASVPAALALAGALLLPALAVFYRESKRAPLGATTATVGEPL
jgi:MFS transporter, DHA3 family, tetracycline resistance protein